MARQLRIDHDGAWHHVMNRGIAHGRLFFDDSDRIEFGARLADVHTRFGIEVHAYCLMDNHYHLLVRCPQARLSVSMQRLGSIFTRHVNDRIGRDGALCRGRFHSRVVDSDEYLLAACRYIHRNCLDLPGVVAPDRYRWSSHRAYLGHRSPPSFLRTDVVLAEFRGDRGAFAAFVMDEQQVARGPRDVAELRRVADVAEIVIAELGLDDHGQLAAMARAATLAHAAAMGVARPLLGQAFGHDTAGSLRTALSRARSLAAAEPRLSSAVDRAIGLAVAPALHQGSDPCCHGQSAARAAS